MKLKKKEIINLPVYTKLGHQLGKIIDFEIDTTFQNITTYIVKSGDFFQEITQKNLLISRDQVVMITDKKMIVEDNLSSSTEKDLQKKAIPAS